MKELIKLFKNNKKISRVTLGITFVISLIIFGFLIDSNVKRDIKEAENKVENKKYDDSINIKKEKKNKKLYMNDIHDVSKNKKLILNVDNSKSVKYPEKQLSNIKNEEHDNIIRTKKEGNDVSNNIKYKNNIDYYEEKTKSVNVVKANNNIKRGDESTRRVQNLNGADIEVTTYYPGNVYGYDGPLFSTIEEADKYIDDKFSNYESDEMEWDYIPYNDKGIEKIGVKIHENGENDEIINYLDSVINGN